jgi:hypothetical protein
VFAQVGLADDQRHLPHRKPAGPEPLDGSALDGEQVDEHWAVGD